MAEVKSDLMGEQTILCGMLQTGSLLCFDRMVAEGVERGYASKLVQYGWETIGARPGGTRRRRSAAVGRDQQAF